ncbi:outer membrane beta-barrel protein [Erythrobacter donghaensis]|uniref:outer membrane beta-barrel protein n=1 Tax=Erythrobacter donghaensis TaxID=267135 RepID=UPI000A3D5DC9|nr:outer membrane beta-barrel protein [Erythrobacter donghaensis]
MIALHLLGASVLAAAPLPADEIASNEVAASEQRETRPEDTPSRRENREKDFTFILSPYVWMPVVAGKVGGTEPGALDFTIDTGDLLEAFNFGGLIHGEVRHKSGWGVAVDYMFADLSTGGSIGIGDLTTTVDASILEVTVLRRVDLGDNALDLYGGIRRWDSDVVVDVDIPVIGFDILTGDTWTDPIVGARYQHRLSRKWQVLVQGDIGGFGADSDFTWHAVAGVDYTLSQRASVQLVYKRLSVERQSPRIGGGAPVDLDLTVQGPLIGFAYRF